MSGKPRKAGDRFRQIGLEEARERVRRFTSAMPAGDVALELGVYRVLARGVRARVDSPTHNVSLKDGFAVVASDTLPALEASPVRLRIIGSRFAGGAESREVRPGTAVRVTSGAVLPAGADAVAGSEHVTAAARHIKVGSPLYVGQNVLLQGTDVRAGDLLAGRGDLLTPGVIGRLAAAGLERVRVCRSPRVALVATGDELVAPGTALKPGQLYASNLWTVAAWLRAFGIESICRVIPDRPQIIRKELVAASTAADVLMTSGGAWGSERDLVLNVLGQLGWRKVFHRVRLGPGKAVGFGLLGSMPVFCLPGGPPSNEMAFLQLALPGTLRLAGWQREPFPILEARLAKPLTGREIDWTQIVRGTLSQDRHGVMWATPRKLASRLASMAVADCLIPIPEGTERLEAGDTVQVQILSPPGSPRPLESTAGRD